MNYKQVLILGLGITVTGITWFGFNAGSEVMVDGITTSAFMVTNIAIGSTILTWVVLLRSFRRFTWKGILTSILVGFAAITPLSGIAGPILGVIVGIIVGVSLFAVEFYVVKKNKKIPAISKLKWEHFAIIGLAITIIGMVAYPVWESRMSVDEQLCHFAVWPYLGTFCMESERLETAFKYTSGETVEIRMTLEQMNEFGADLHRILGGNYCITITDKANQWHASYAPSCD